MPHHAVVRTGPRTIEQATESPGVAPERSASAEAGDATPGATREPTALRCLQCGTTWYSRVATLIVESGMGCARCGATLSIPGREDDH
jgi:hypothetical protein